MEIDRTHSSPNHSSRLGRKIALVVMHATAGTYASALSWLTTAASRVSSHYLVRKDGHINQLVKDDQAAWHAGHAAWNGQTAINEISLGIELENANDGKDPYPAVQLAAAAALVRSKMAEYQIPIRSVVRHLDIATPKGRKTDPAGLDWPAFLASIAPDPLPNSPPPLTGMYQVRRIAVYEGPSTMFPIALGGGAFLNPGDPVEIDEVKPEWGGFGHLKSGVGFVSLSALERP